METNDERLSLVNIKGGALLEAVDIRLDEIVENLKDPNTTDDKRELTIKIAIKPDPERQFAQVVSSCSCKLAPDKSISTHAAISMSGGKPALFEIKRQEQSIFDASNVTPMGRRSSND